MMVVDPEVVTRSGLLALFLPLSGLLVGLPVYARPPATLRKFREQECLWPAASREIVFSNLLASWPEYSFVLILLSSIGVCGEVMAGWRALGSSVRRTIGQ